MTFTHLSDLLVDFGQYQASRIRMVPLPGSATEADVLEVERTEGKHCELIDGVLVEKTMGFRESLVAAEVNRRVGNFVAEHKLGRVATADGTIMLFPSQIRIPDGAFYSWSQFPGRKVPSNPIPDLHPDLAIEVLGESNTQAEMIRKLKDYFSVGTKLVWFIDPDGRTAQAFTAPEQFATLTEADDLTGGDVLPGFRLNLGELFSAAGV
jgi:Uma2 family endonuclease